MQIEALRKPLFHLTIVGAEPDLQSKTINFCLQKKVLLSKKVYKHKFIRNFEEFKALHDGLVDFFWKILIPALPKKPSFRFLKDLDYVEEYKLALNVFLVRIQNVDELLDSLLLRKFCDPHLLEFLHTADRRIGFSSDPSFLLQKFAKTLSFFHRSSQSGILCNPKFLNIPDKNEYDAIFEKILLVQTNFKALDTLFEQKLEFSQRIMRSYTAISNYLTSLLQDIEHPTSAMEYFSRHYASLCDLQNRQEKTVQFCLGSCISQTYQNFENMKPIMNHRTVALIKFRKVYWRCAEDTHQLPKGNQLKEEYCEASKCMSRNWQELQDYSEKHLVKNIKIFIAQQLQLEGGKLSYLQKALEEVALTSAASREFNKARDKN